MKRETKNILFSVDSVQIIGFYTGVLDVQYIEQKPWVTRTSNRK